MSADTVAQMLTSGWPGRAVQHMDDPIGAWPQFMDPSPRVILEAPFRRALVHALDRQLMADNLEYGLSQVPTLRCGPTTRCSGTPSRA